VKIGIVKEGKVPIDRRVPLTPVQIQSLHKQYSEVSVVVQPSNIRCFSDEDYTNEGIALANDLSDCDVLMGVKEVPIDQLVSGKTYFFFSHTIKKQAYNRQLLQAILDKKITLVDYETLTNSAGTRIIAFGRWAGIVGAYNGLLTYGKRYNLFALRPAHLCFDLNDLKSELSKVHLPKIKIVITGGGRVAKGAIEILNSLSIKKVTPAAFLSNEFTEPVFTQLNARNYNRRIEAGEFNRSEYYRHPDRYENTFLRFAHEADLLLACAFWDPRAPKLFNRSDVMGDRFKISVIADITCDIDGSIPSTKRASTIDAPIYDYNPSEDKVEAPLTDEANITVMAVDNLPCELPRDASESFGGQFITNVLPDLIAKNKDGVVQRATIATEGRLTEKFAYLQDYVDGKG
jgi:alanine dehydrogenase